MDHDEARAALAAAVEGLEEPTVANFLIRGPGMLDGEPTRIDFEAELAREVIDDVLGFARGLLERELVAYDPSFQPSSGQALVDDLAESPELAALTAQILADSPPIDRREGEPIAALAHRLDGTAGPAFVVYRIKGPGIATRRAGGIRILVPRDGVYVRVPDELVYYQPRFDALAVGDAVIVTAPTTLQRALGSDSRAKRMATETFARATAQIAIQGMDGLAEAIATDPAMIAKMAQLSRTLDADPSYGERLTTPRILEFLDENPQIAIATTGTGAERRLVFESSPQKRYLIPKTLADDFLRSELTDRKYEVGSKQRIDVL